MVIKCHRVFVGNLPHEVTRNDVVDKFKKYGNVESVEIKNKRDPSSDQISSTFCFVNLNIDTETVETCIQLLDGIKWDGQHIKVQLAKESFLQRLQRERQSSVNQPSTVKALPAEPLNSRPIDTCVKAAGNNLRSTLLKSTITNKKRKKVSSSSESSDSDDDRETVHPTSKLPKFKGTSAFLSSDSSLKVNQYSSETQGQGTAFSPRLKSTTSLRDRENGIDALGSKSKETKSYNGNEIPRKKVESKPSSLNDVLEKFESFSDVWKDADEPSVKMQHLSFVSPRKSNLSQGLSSEKQLSFEKRQQGNRMLPLQRDSIQVVSRDARVSNTLPTNLAEEKRLKSLDAKRQAFEQQKQAVKLALSDKSAPRMNKKIVFDEETNLDEDYPKGTIQDQDLTRKHKDLKEKKNTKTLKLFDDSDDESNVEHWNDEFKVKKQFEGKKGQKLLDLQTRYNNDQRFKLDERFYESDDEGKTKRSSEVVSETQQSAETIEGLAEEREQQLQILSSVLGKPVPLSQPSSYHESKAKGMLRFDPLKPHHSRYVLTKESQEKKKSKKLKSNDSEKGKTQVEEDEEETIKPKMRREEKDPEPVSQSKFYSMSDALAESLKQAKEGQSSGFSLLQMFGPSSTDTGDKEDHEEKICEDREKKSGLKNRRYLNDSSSEEEEPEEGGPTAYLSSKEQSREPEYAQNTVKSTGGVWQESFFFQPDDSRLKEGAQFFSQIDSSSDPTTFAKKREALRHIVKSKLRNSSRKANSFKTKVSTLRKKASLWPAAKNNGQRQKRKMRH